ncbi:MAG: sensor histidine kinase [Candidatus Binatia bacterium]
MAANPREHAPDLFLVPHDFTSSLDPKVILSSLVDRASEILGATRASVVRLDPERHPGRAFVFTATGDPSIEGYALALDDYPEIQAVIEHQHALLVRDHPDDPIAARVRARHRKLPFPLSVLFPLAYRERSYGVLFLRFADGAHPLSRGDLEFCELVAFGAAVALHNAHAHEEALAELRRREHEAERSEEAHRLRMEMLSSASHDLRTPLHSMVGYVDLLLENVYGEIGGEQRETLGHVAASAQSLLDIVNNLVDFARIEDGRNRLDVTPGEVSRLLEDLRFTIEPLGRQRGLELSFETIGTIPTVHTDWSKLKRVLLNLLHNAIKFTETGTVAVRAWAERGRAWFDVVDTGTGIPREKVDQIFDRFYRVDPRQAEDPGGLGLAIVKRHCELLRGTVSVQSRRGKGTRFRVAIPLSITP